MVDEQASGQPGGHETATARPVMVLEEPPVTGDAAVDDAVARFTELLAVPLHDHPALFEDVHRTLTDRLADVEG